MLHYETLNLECVSVAIIRGFVNPRKMFRVYEREKFECHFVSSEELNWQISCLGINSVPSVQNESLSFDRLSSQ